ncbi:MAG: recombinase family protein [Defluviitaleaceae bacterium]|nr:recombinase family protein [Defluviitaleaceae bacterium]
MKQVEVIKASNNLTNRVFSKTLDRLRVAAYCRVSTDSEDQLNSYKSQVQYYTDYIQEKKEWVLAGIYADEAITGTQTKNREDFQRLMNDCLNGDVDMIITKAISRFARNTLDTLKYVRMLKEKNIAVFFEDENINTLTMDGELLLVILSSVAQQEVENISSNVKKGLKMKMQRGELVGFQGCLGYDYHPDTKMITVNQEEAEIVRYIFNRYVEGMGCSVIGQELTRMGHKTKRGSVNWAETTIIGIIKNEKYKGDIRQGKTFTVDPISKRRLDNFGEQDQFYIHKNHEPIINDDLYDAAQQILARRSKARKIDNGKRDMYSRKYAFSSMLDCGFCGSNLSRRNWHSSSEYQKVIWQCIVNTKKGKRFCPDAKGIGEETIEQAFIESYRVLCNNNKDVIEELLQRIEKTLCSSNSTKKINHLEKEITALEHKRKKLVDMRLDDIIDIETYEEKYADINAALSKLAENKERIKNVASRELDVKQRIEVFRRVLEQNEVITEFDRVVFESIIEKVVVGGIDSNGEKDPAMLTFIYRTGFTNSVNGNDFKKGRRNAKVTPSESSGNKLCSNSTVEVSNSCSSYNPPTCGVRGFPVL